MTILERSYISAPELNNEDEDGHTGEDEVTVPTGGIGEKNTELSTDAASESK